MGGADLVEVIAEMAFEQAQHRSVTAIDGGASIRSPTNLLVTKGF